MCLVLHDRLWFVQQGGLLETEWNHVKMVENHVKIAKAYD
jgi:hypothetical protein